MKNPSSLFRKLTSPFASTLALAAIATAAVAADPIVIRIGGTLDFPAELSGQPWTLEFQVPVTYDSGAPVNSWTASTATMTVGTGTPLPQPNLVIGVANDLPGVGDLLFMEDAYIGFAWLPRSGFETTAIPTGFDFSRPLDLSRFDDPRISLTTSLVPGEISVLSGMVTSYVVVGVNPPNDNPVQMLGQMISGLGGLQLSAKSYDHLLRRLNRIMERLQNPTSGNLQAVAGELGAFMNHVSAQRVGPNTPVKDQVDRIPAAAADSLISAARAIADRIIRSVR